MRSTASEQFRTAEQNLESKKYKLFTSRNIEKWGTKSSEFKEQVETVLGDYRVASKYILPDETTKLKSVKQLSEFISHSLYYEYVLFNRRDGKRIVKNFNRYAKKVRRATQKDNTIWNIFEKENVDDQDLKGYGGPAPQKSGKSGDILADLDSNLGQALREEKNREEEEGNILD